MGVAEDNLGAGAALNPKSPKKSKLSLRAILREVLSANEKVLAKKVIDFLIRKLLSNSKIENPQIAKLIMEHIDGKPTQTIVEMAGPENVFDGLPPEELLQLAGLHLVDEETGKVRPADVVKSDRRKAAARKGVETRRRNAAKKKAKAKKKTRRGGRRGKKKEGE